MEDYEELCASFFHCLLDKCFGRLGECNPKNIHKIKLFLEIESSVINETDGIGERPLLKVLTSDNCSIEIVTLLLDNGANAQDRDETCGASSVMVALRHKRDDDVIRVLIERGAYMKAKDVFGSTTLCHALGCGASIEIIKLILDAGCHPNDCRRHVSALECASKKHADGDEFLKEGVLDLIVKEGADVLSFGRGGESPICIALRGGAGLGDIQHLLRLGVSLDACRKHDSPWLCATDFKAEARQMMGRHSKISGMPLKADVFELLQTANAPVDSVDEEGHTPLQLALFFCDYQTRAIKLLMDLPGTDFSVKDEDNQNLLHLAVKNSHCKPSAVKFLMERGVKVDELNDNRETPLCSGIWKCSFSVVKLLLKSGSPVNTKDCYGLTPLNRAVAVKNFDTIQLLLFAGARIRFEGNSQDEILLISALVRFLRDKCQEKLEIFKLLLKHYFLENPDFEINRLVGRRLNHGSMLINQQHINGFRLFQIITKGEIVKMKSSYLGINCTLFDFVNRIRFPTQTAATNSSSLSEEEFNRLLTIMVEHDFSQYFELIANVVGKSTMETKFQELKVYAVKNDPDFNGTNEKIGLDYDSVCEISEFLSSSNLLSLVLAYAQENHAHRQNDAKGRGKRYPGPLVGNFSKSARR